MPTRVFCDVLLLFLNDQAPRPPHPEHYFTEHAGNDRKCRCIRRCVCAIRTLPPAWLDGAYLQFYIMHVYFVLRMHMRTPNPGERIGTRIGSLSI